MNDRRSEERLQVCLDAVWGGTFNRPARITDLSEGGCFVDAVVDTYIGEKLTFRVPLPDGAWLELTGEVAHHFPTVGFGLRFIDLTDEQCQQLRSFISYLKGPHDPVTAILR